MAQTFSPGTRLAGYRLDELVDEGGMGTVFAAEQQYPRRKVAIKLVAGELAEAEEFRERFVRESNLAAAIEHPHILPVYEAGAVDGVLYLAMRYVDGYDLRSLLEREGPLDAERAVFLAAQVGAALDAAHGAGLIHRDVKPANVLIAPGLAGGHREHAYLSDFGVAKRSSSQTLTAPGGYLGTIAYSAPEQIKGEPLDGRADLYSLACLLFECLTGAPPFEGEHDAAVLYAHVEAEPPSVRTRRPDLPPSLDSVFVKALAKASGERHATCEDFIGAVRRALMGVNVTGPTNLPAETTPLVGRVREIEELQALLSRDEVRLVTLTGAGGTGKTRLARATAVAVSAQFPDGTFLVRLASIRDSTLISSSIARDLGIAPTTDDLGLVELKEFLRSKRLLLVLDSFEHLIANATLVPELLAAAPRLKLLVTSQTVLRVSGEHEFAVPPLPTPHAGLASDLGALAECESVALFVQRARASRPDFELTTENAEAVAEICARLDGLPLAIELAAARTKRLAPGLIVRRLSGHRLELLTGGMRDLPERQRTLRSTIDWSYGLLSEVPSEKRMFERLSVFAGGCSEKAAEAVCGDAVPVGGDVLDGLDSLADKSLLRQWEASDGEPRYGMLETIREYARERLGDRPEEAEVLRRHAEYYVAYAEEAESKLTGPAQATWLRRLEEEHANLRAVLSRSVDRGDAEVGLRLAGALWRFWRSRGFVREGLRWFTTAFEMEDKGRPLDRAKALTGAAALAFAQGDDERAEGFLLEAHGLAEESGDKAAIARAVHSFGVVSVGRAFAESDPRTRERHYARAKDFLRDSLPLFRGVEDELGIACLNDNMGVVSLYEGELDSAEAFLQDALDLARDLEDKAQIATTLLHLALLTLERGDREGARITLAESLRLVEEVGSREWLAECLELIALSWAEEQPLRAARLWGAAAEVRAAIGVRLRPAEQTLQDRHLQIARETVGDAAFADAETAGRSMPFERAVEEAYELVAADSDVARTSHIFTTMAE